MTEQQGLTKIKFQRKEERVRVYGVPFGTADVCEQNSQTKRHSRTVTGIILFCFFLCFVSKKVFFFFVDYNKEDAPSTSSF